MILKDRVAIVTGATRRIALRPIQAGSPVPRGTVSALNADRLVHVHA